MWVLKDPPPSLTQLDDIWPADIRPGQVLRIDGSPSRFHDSILESYYQHVLLVRRDQNVVQLVTRTLNETEEEALRQGQDLFDTDGVRGELTLWNFVLGERTYQVYRPRSDGRGESLVDSRTHVFRKRAPGPGCVELGR